MSKESLANKRVRKGDKVIVIAGNDKGRTGEVLSRNGNRIVIQGINVRKKHLKRSETNPNGIVELEMPIHASNVMLCAGENEGVRTYLKEDDSGVRQVCYKHNGAEVVHRTLNKAK